MTTPKISIVIATYHQQAVLENFYQRLMPTMDRLNQPYEVIFVDACSRDQTPRLLNTLFEQRPDVIRIIHLNSHYDQNLALMAGLENARGDTIVTLDAAQNAPEDIPNFITTIAAGYDVVGGYRENRHPQVWHQKISQLKRYLRSKIMPNLVMQDESCILRAYRRHIVDLMVSSQEPNPFVNALALSYARKPTEIAVTYETHATDKSNHTVYQLLRHQFDLITNFSLLPLQIFTLLGLSVSALSGILVLYLLLRRFIIGPEAEGIFTLFAIAFFLLGLCILGLGILGEYIGRVYQEVRKRPRFVIREISGD